MKWHYVLIAIAFMITGQLSKYISFKQALGIPITGMDTIMIIIVASIVMGLTFIAKMSVETHYITELNNKRLANGAKTRSN